jgi:penicillin-binding protein A
MSPAVRPVAVALLLLIGAVALWLGFVATDAGSRYGDDPRDPRAAAVPDGPRGSLITADGVTVAADDGDRGRAYPRGEAYAHLVGYDTGTRRTGLEATRRRALLSRDDGSLTSWLRRILGEDLGPPDVRLTVIDAVQRAAVDALRGHTGAVIALDPRTGAVLAYVSSPSFDPNAVVAGRLHPDDVAVDRVAGRLLPPGSTFKLVMAAAALAAGADPDSGYDDTDAYTPPGGGLPIRNASGRTCAGGGSITLLEAVAVSCNTVFARLAVDLGGAVVVRAAEAAGFNGPVRWELGGQRSVIPPADLLDADPPALAQSGIGERDVRATPLLMAMLTAAIANDGVIMAPYVVDAVVAANGSVLATTDPQVAGRAMRTEVATALRDMMRQVVERGTGTRAAVPGLTVSGKTGTAEGGGGPHAWFVGFAPFDEPQIVVVVVVESAGSGATGGRTAAPMAARIFAAWSDASE